MPERMLSHVTVASEKLYQKNQLLIGPLFLELIHSSKYDPKVVKLKRKHICFYNFCFIFKLQFPIFNEIL